MHLSLTVHCSAPCCWCTGFILSSIHWLMSCLILEGPATHCILYTAQVVKLFLLEGGCCSLFHCIGCPINLREVLRCTKYHISSSSKGLTSLHQAKLIVRFPFLPACMLFCRCHKIFIIRHFTLQIFPKIPKIFVVEGFKAIFLKILS